MQRRIDIASRQHDDRTVPELGLSRQKCRKRDRPARFDDKLVPPRLALSRISQAKNRMEGPDALRGNWNLRDKACYSRVLPGISG